MSIVLSFELDKTYGTQNEDVAKKNKYNAVQVTRDIVVNNMEQGQQHDYIAEFSQSTTQSDNNYNNSVGLKYGERVLYDEGLFNTSYRTKINNAIAQIYYKNYSISLDLSLSDYDDLITKLSVPQFDYLFDGTKYDEIYNPNKEFDSGNVDYTPAQWETFLNSNLQQDGFNLASSHASLISRNLYTVNENIYRKTVEGVEGDYNALDDVLTTIQNGYDTTQDANFSNVYDYIKPKITNWTNDGSTITFQVQLPYMIKLFDAVWTKKEQNSTIFFLGSDTSHGIVHGDYTSYNYYEYIFSNFKIRFYNDYEITGTQNETYHQGNRVYSSNDSFLFTKGNKYGNSSGPEYSQKFADEIYNNYQNGKLTLDIKYPLGPIYDDMANQLYYINNVGIVRKVGENYFDSDGNVIVPADTSSVSEHLCPEEGMKCIITKHGIPVTKNDNFGDIQYYYVQNSNINYNGIALNELTLAESNSDPDSYIVMFETPEHCTMRVVYRGNDIQSGASVEKNYSLDIYMTFDTHYGMPQNQLYINGQAVSPAESGRWIWTNIAGNITIVAPVQYLGGKYLFLDIDSDDITMKSGLTNGMEIFTNDYIQIAGNVSSGLTPRFLIDGVKQTITPLYGYDFIKNVDVKNKDIYVSVKTTSLARTVTVTFDDEDAVRDLSQPFYKIYSSEINPSSEQSNVYNNGTVYLEDKVEPYAISLNAGYSISSSTITGLKDVGGHLYEVTDNILASYETQLAQTTCTLYIFNGAISYNWNKYMGYNLYVNRIASKSGGTLGPITAYSGVLNGVRYVGYDVFVDDTIQFTIEMLDVDTGLPVIVETTVTATPQSGSSIDFNNGDTFKTKTIRYDISATIS